MQAADEELLPTDYPPVRLATQRDEPELMDMAYAMHRDSVLMTADGALFPLDVGKVRDTLLRAIVPNRNEDDPAWIGVVGDHAGLHGAIYLSVELPWYSEAPAVNEKFLYVRSEYRRTCLAGRLISFAKESAEAIGMPLVMGHMTAGREAAKQRFFRRHFGEPVGGYFVHQGHVRSGG